ncbi:DUF1289 domain-containing protein [Motiliproteus coralliicola]|uniref:DUF1289 domain-containing protein n=1 Tax=Motiliproteus coralliicola TaxID=2283196 RepID=A0A369WKP1_9GAMM|nr:DUF1289 domain-containing protein [Motiliproteus coralliicola]RDE22630.1 DUF1289 domain-containing protein [Motiliproteus coralliicola]
MAVETVDPVQQADPSEQTEDERPVPSPCIAACELNAEQFCTGCHRHVDEVAGWKRMDNDARRQVLAKIEQRKAQQRSGLLGWLGRLIGRRN